jgi:aspartate ammonia-lyase
MLSRFLFALVSVVVSDRTVHVGAPISGVSFFGGLTLSQAHQWLAFYATVMGALGSTAVLVYTIIKTVRLLKNPPKTE